MLPDTDELPDVLLDLAVPHEDINALVTGVSALTGDAGAMRLLDACVAELTPGATALQGTSRLGELLTGTPPALGAHFAAYVFVAALPHTRAYHRERGVPAEVTRRTLADLGRNMASHRRLHGTGGVRAPEWLVRHFRGELYQLGRLQFERARAGERTAPLLRTVGLACDPDTRCLHLHIPDFRGPLTPTACDRSLELARRFFAAHFPEEAYPAGVCRSWLLDPQLRRYLPAGSNIIRFQERFRVAVDDTGPSDTTPVRFVFGDPDLPVDGLPRRSSLERAVGDHLRAGGHWYLGHGWFPL
ncbi:acyltransferase domain-containing protein [Streptomyces ziwulingensis]|uniref:Acyltransferase domain-containing protein n=1 Tax=Streptomyces ziwulingensis TaxID=1045501 RepID=A0ABP9CS77_9ACTN